MTSPADILDLDPEYAETSAIDRLRATDYSRLDRIGHVYLDYTGGGLYGDSQIREHQRLLTEHVFGNPHSASPSSAGTTKLVEQARAAILAYFRAGGDYTLVFTPNASAALKLVGESFPFEPGGRLLLATDNHNSANGIREFARAKGVAADYTPLTNPDLRIDRPQTEALLDQIDRSRANLFVFPAQSNFSGVQHRLDLVDAAQSRGWQVLLDAAAYVPTSRLDLGTVKPDFVAISFYKMFGYPTGVGCLIARKTSLARLRRPWFAGGTVNFATVQGRLHLLAPGEAGFEDGTLNYLSIPAVEIGLRHIERIGLDLIQTRVRCLTGWLLTKLLALKHANGRPMVRVYGPTTTVERGGTITLNLYDPEGHLVDYRRVEELAGLEGISLRTGCFCNPGVGETAEGLTEEDMRAGIEADAQMTLPRFLQVIQHRGGKSAGSIRVSFGLASNIADADRFLKFAATFCDQTSLTLGAVTFDIESYRVIRDGS